MENLWKELLAYVKKKNSSEKGFRICREGHFIEKCFKMYSTTCSDFYGI